MCLAGICSICFAVRRTRTSTSPIMITESNAGNKSIAVFTINVSASSSAHSTMKLASSNLSSSMEINHRIFVSFHRSLLSDVGIVSLSNRDSADISCLDLNRRSAVSILLMGEIASRTMMLVLTAVEIYVVAMANGVIFAHQRYCARHELFKFRSAHSLQKPHHKIARYRLEFS